jgi:surface polysaccharide O-acyltransferase-like enzyme
MTTHLADIATKFLGPYLFIIPLFLMELLVSFLPATIGRRDFGGWSLLTYLIFFICGYLLASDKRYRAAIEKIRFISLALSLLTVYMGYLSIVEWDLPGHNPLYLMVRAINSWSWLLSFVGFSSHHLNFNNRFLKYANEAVLPFYVFHQTVIVVIGYFIKDWTWAVFPKYLLLAAASFILIMVLYEFVVKRVNVLRYLFGMKKQKTEGK